MSNIYIVIKKRFYEQKGIDYSFPVDYRDVRTFSNAEKADEFVQSEINNYAEKIDSPPFGKYEYADYEFNSCNGRYKAYKTFVQERYNDNGVRICYMITKQKIE